jgi:hypothetical protein
MALAAFSRPSTILVQEEVRRRIRFLLQSIVSTDEFNAFMELLGRTDGLLIGSIVRLLLQKNSEAEKVSRVQQGDTVVQTLHVLLPDAEGGVFIKAMEQFKYRVLLPKEKGTREKVPTVPSVETTVLIATAKNDFSVSDHLTGRANAHCQHSMPVRRYDHRPPLRATSSGNAAEREANYRHERDRRAGRVLRLSQSSFAQRSCSLRRASLFAWGEPQTSGSGRGDGSAVE